MGCDTDNNYQEDFIYSIHQNPEHFEPNATPLGILNIFNTFKKIEKLDCSKRASQSKDPTWDCEKASTWSADCVPGWLFEEWDCLELDANAVLCDENESFNLTVYLTTNDVKFDGNGQTIDHRWKNGMSSYPGVRTPYTYSISNVEIR